MHKHASASASLSLSPLKHFVDFDKMVQVTCIHLQLHPTKCKFTALATIENNIRQSRRWNRNEKMIKTIKERTNTFTASSSDAYDIMSCVTFKYVLIFTLWTLFEALRFSCISQLGKKVCSCAHAISSSCPKPHPVLCNSDSNHEPCEDLWR
jgi:hypothetical protein